MFVFPSLVPALPLGAIDTAAVGVVAILVGAVVLVLWASRPSVIARYADPDRRPADEAAQEAPPAATASAPRESRRPA